VSSSQNALVEMNCGRKDVALSWEYRIESQKEPEDVQLICQYYDGKVILDARCLP